MAAELKRFSLEEVSKHKDPKGESKQVWLVIHDYVYDVTKFLDEVNIETIFWKVDGFNHGDRHCA
jgi:hypothetical protein